MVLRNERVILKNKSLENIRHIKGTKLTDSFFFNLFMNSFETYNTLHVCYPTDKNILQIIPLRKHAYLNILKILPPKEMKKVQIKISDIFHNSAQNIECEYSLKPPRRGGSNGYPQSLF